MKILDNVITDRGSKYAASGGPCHSADEARAFLIELKRNKRFTKATNNSWGLICGDQKIKNDDGEAGAGISIGARTLLRPSGGAGARGGIGQSCSPAGNAAENGDALALQLLSIFQIEGS